MTEKEDADLSELVKARELITKKCGQSVEERAREKDEDHRDSQPSNDVLAKSCANRRRINKTSTIKNCVRHNEVENDDSNSFSGAVERTRLPNTITNRKRYIIRSAKTNGIRVSSCKAPSSVRSSSKTEKTRKWLDANKLTERLQMLLSAQDDGIAPPQNYQEIDSILFKLREMQVIL